MCIEGVADQYKSPCGIEENRTHSLNSSTEIRIPHVKADYSSQGISEFLFLAIGKLCPDTEAVSFSPTDYSPTAYQSQVNWLNLSEIL